MQPWGFGLIMGICCRQFSEQGCINYFLRGVIFSLTIDGQDSKSLYEARRSFPKRYESEKGADRVSSGLLLSDTLVIGRGIAGRDA